MASAADYTIIVLLAALGAGLWTVFDRVSQVHRELEALRRRLDAGEPPPPQP